MLVVGSRGLGACLQHSGQQRAGHITCSGQWRAGHTPAVKSRDVQLPWSALVGAMLVSLLLHHFPKEVLWTVFPEAHTGVHSPWMAVDVKAR